jgi:hypothetical protein
MDLPLGEHTLQVVGINSTGEQLAVSMPVVVVENKAAALAQAKPDQATDSAAPGTEATLNTAADLFGVMFAVGALASLFLFFVWRRRKKEQAPPGAQLSAS